MIRTILVFLLLANTLFGQDDPNSTLLFGDQIISSKTPAEGETLSILDQLEAVTTDEFSPNDGSLLTHFVEDHQGARLLKKLHEYIHQRIEALRPAGVHAYVVMEATQDEYDTFMSGAVAQEMLRGNWVIVRQDKRPGNKVANFVVIGKTHYSHVGYMTREALQRIVDKATPRKSQPLKQAKWKISRLVMHTQPNCPPCKAWKEQNLSAVLADGVEFVEAAPDYRRTPAFDVTYCNGDQCLTKHFGNTSYASMRKQFNDDDFTPAPAGD